MQLDFCDFSIIGKSVNARVKRGFPFERKEMKERFSSFKRKGKKGKSETRNPKPETDRGKPEKGNDLRERA